MKTLAMQQKWGIHYQLSLVYENEIWLENELTVGI